MKTAVVTGSGPGIGRAVADRLRRDGYRVATLDLAASDAKWAYTADVTDRAAVDGAPTAVRDHLGPVAVLVNAAGLESFKRFSDLTVEAFNRVIDVNSTVSFTARRRCCPTWPRRGPLGITVDAVPPGFIDTPMPRKSEERGLLGVNGGRNA